MLGMLPSLQLKDFRVDINDHALVKILDAEAPTSEPREGLPMIMGSPTAPHYTTRFPLNSA